MLAARARAGRVSLAISQEPQRFHATGLALTLHETSPHCVLGTPRFIPGKENPSLLRQLGLSRGFRII
jgi:hypothetical protein